MILICMILKILAVPLMCCLSFIACVYLYVCMFNAASMHCPCDVINDNNTNSYPIYRYLGRPTLVGKP